MDLLIGVLIGAALGYGFRAVISKWLAEKNINL